MVSSSCWDVFSRVLFVDKHQAFGERVSLYESFLVGDKCCLCFLFVCSFFWIVHVGKFYFFPSFGLYAIPQRDCFVRSPLVNIKKHFYGHLSCMSACCVLWHFICLWQKWFWIKNWKVWSVSIPASRALAPRSPLLSACWVFSIESKWCVIGALWNETF